MLSLFYPVFLMDPPPLLLIASFTGSVKMCICRHQDCWKAYSDCSCVEKEKWKLIPNSWNTASDSIQWFCGPCSDYYHSKSSTYIWSNSGKVVSNVALHLMYIHWWLPGDIAETHVNDVDDIRRNVTSAQRGKGMIWPLFLSLAVT